MCFLYLHILQWLHPGLSAGKILLTNSGKSCKLYDFCLATDAKAVMSSIVKVCVSLTSENNEKVQGQSIVLDDVESSKQVADTEEIKGGAYDCDMY